LHPSKGKIAKIECLEVSAGDVSNFGGEEIQAMLIGFG
jgi:hypothetical protein